MVRCDHDKSTRLNHDWTKTRKGIAVPISLGDVMEKEVQSSLQYGGICELSVLADPSNEDLTLIKPKRRILGHPTKLIEVLRARLVIA